MHTHTYTKQFIWNHKSAHSCLKQKKNKVFEGQTCWLGVTVFPTLVHSGCHKKCQDWVLKQQKFILSQFWRLEVQHRGGGRFPWRAGLVPSEAPVFRSLWTAIFALRPHMTTPWACVHPGICPSVCISFSQKDTSQVGLGPTLRTSF